jgi:penicillin-binding protein 2
MVEERRPAITPQLAVRVAILGGLALVVFGIIFFRLWFLQVLSGEDYVAQANDNQVRKISVQAPRGDIVDRNGTALVENRVATAVQIDPRALPAPARDLADAYLARTSAAEREARLKRGRRNERLRRMERQASTRAERREARAAARRAAGRPISAETVKVPRIPRGATELRARYERLSRVIGDISPETIHERVTHQLAQVPYASITIKTDVPLSVLAYLSERRRDFPGITPRKIYLRSYPHGTTAAQLFGTVGEISPAELKMERFRGVEQGTIVGKGGIEHSYDRYLRGKNGATRVQVDSMGRPKGELRVIEPKQGKQLKLSIDLSLQAAGQDAMKQAISMARGNGNAARAAGFVAMDPRNGEVLGLGSVPSFDPNIFAKPISQAKFNSVKNAPGAPLYNRAVAGLYPTASTFKLITALAGLDAGIITPETVVDDPGVFHLGTGSFQNAGGVAHGALALRRAIQVSSDVFFYKIGARADQIRGEAIQKWARRLSLGRKTGIDLPGEAEGLVPDRKWRAGIAKRELDCRKRRKVPACGISDGRPWSAGDNVNLSVGQGDIQVSPLQMAVAYAAVANGGKVVRPHLGLQIEDNAGRVLQTIEPDAARKVDIPRAHRQAIMDGLRMAASAGGTSGDVFKDFPLPVFGKTGTAERPPNPDQSWYVAYVPHKTRPIVVATTVEGGGFGAEAAAPATRLILSEWFDVTKKVVAGTSRTN